MTADPITAALHVAADAMFMEAAPEEAPLAADCPEAHQALVRQAAAAIEAFHRRMAEHWRGFAPDWQARHTQMADSVARAAQEGGR